MRTPKKTYGLDYFNDNVLDNFFNDSFFRNTSMNAMKTDIEEKDGKYLFSIDLPGYSKEDIKINYEDGYLNIAAQKNTDKEEKDQDGKVIRQERYQGSVSRSFYLGKNLDESAFEANYNDGVLSIVVPTKELEKAEEKKYIEVK